MSNANNMVVVITGASAGVGRATARAYGKAGARVGLLARGEDGLAAARREVEQAGGDALVVPTDVADQKEVEAAADAVEEAFGPIDIWVNNAMVSVFGPVTEMTSEEYRRVTAVTYLGVVHGTLTALDRMLPRDNGVIVQVGSALAYRGIPLQSAYCGAKHAIQGFTESVRSELLHENRDVELTMVQMPALNTPQFDWSRNHTDHRPQPMPPIYQPEVAAGAIRWAAAHDRSELWVGWPTIKAIVGNRLAPRLLDGYLARSGYESQLTDEADPDRQDNLYDPVTGDHGAQGRFGGRARDSSLALWAITHPWELTVLVGVVLGVVFGLVWGDDDHR